MPVLVEAVPDFGPGPAPTKPLPTTCYDHLFGETVDRSRGGGGAPAAAEEEPDRRPPATPTPTARRSSGRSCRRGAHRAPAEEPAQPGPDEVWGVLCPEGHANPPHTSACRTCGTALPDADPVPVPRPPLGLLRVSDGTEVLLDRTVLIGRAPSANRFPAPVPPRLLRVISPQQDVSRTHVEVRLEGWDVLVVDLSSNGTRLIRPGAEPQMLPPGEPVPGAGPGPVLDLGDGVSVTYEARTDVSADQAG